MVKLRSRSQTDSHIARGASYRQGKSGEESDFTAEDYQAFDAKLQEETNMALKWGKDDLYAKLKTPSLGCELESCLADLQGMPSPESAKFMEYFANDNGYYEMSKFNLEFEIAPVQVDGWPFSELYEALENNRRHSSRCADQVDSKVMLFGILPSLAAEHFSEDMITDRQHFRVLGKQLQALNKNCPFVVNIGHGDGLNFEADNLSIEGAATSLQVHLAVGEAESAAYYNAAQMVSAMTVGVAANSPFLMGRQLWAETRVPLFEQIMYERFGGGGGEQLSFGRRCNGIFGENYLRQSLLELLSANYSEMSTVLPIVRDTPPEKMLHLILHNRDILRWNRPVLGFMDGKPFLRIEHRVLPSGPTVTDMVANVAFFTGLVCHLQNAFADGVGAVTAKRLPFEVIRENFYRAARDGMDAEITWLDGVKKLRPLVLGEGLNYAMRGLLAIGVKESEARNWLDVIRCRTDCGQNGSVWQRRYLSQHGNDRAGMLKMVNTYWRKQEEGAPVHEWKY